MKKMIMTAVALFNIMSAGYASSSQTAYNEHLGPYGELNLGTNLYYAGFVSSHGSAGTGGIIGYGWSTAAGYYLTNSFALEAGFMQNYTKYSHMYHINAPYVTTRFNLPISNRFSLIAKVGAMDVIANRVGDNGHDTSVLLPFVGVGASYALTNKLDATIQYQGAVYGICGVGLLSAGLAYHF